MPFTVVSGTFHVVNYSPDGDSIRFAPDDPSLLQDLEGFRPKLNKQGHAQLRIEAIDALETHYTPPVGGGTYHQPLELAQKAQALLLDYLGIDGLEWDERRRTVLAANDGTRGYILTRSVEKNGRPVAFVYAGEAPADDGADFHLDTSHLARSYNHLALREGLAYATFYRGLFDDLRAELITAVADARQAKRHIHAVDATTDGFEMANLRSITAEHVIMPKLFRRLVQFYVEAGTTDGFKESLRSAREPVLDLRAVNFTHFDTFVEQEDGSRHLRLTRRPEEIVFDEMKHRPKNVFALALTEGVDFRRLRRPLDTETLI